MNTLNEVMDTILSSMPLPDKIRFMNTKEEDLIMYHLSFGMQIRNSFNLWKGNPALLKDMELSLDTHPDEVSQKIIEALWQKLNNPEKEK